MKHEGIKHVALALTLALSAVSCGSGSSNLAEGGIGGTGISMGTVTGFGSIWVNGVHFETLDTKVYKEGIQVGIDDDGKQIGSMLGEGMVVTVKGTINTNGMTGTATSVSYSNILEGPIEGQPTSNTFVVLGQKVIVDNLTTFKDVLPADITGLAANNVVEVSGFVDSNGDIRASYIENTSSSNLEIKGLVDPTPSQYAFTIGALTVDTLAIGRDVSSLGGQYVAVKGNSYAGGVLTASNVEVVATALDTKDYEEAEMEGIVTRLESATSFILGGQTVHYDGNTSFNGGLSADILPGAKLEVEGSYSRGVLSAEEISFEDGIELEGDVATVVGTTVTLAGLPSISIEVDDVLTDFEGFASNSGELAKGQHLRIRGRENSGVVLATRLESANETKPDVVLQGPLQGKTEPFVQVLGVTVDTSNLTFVIDSADNQVDSATFFDMVVVNDLVELEGTWSGSGTPNWTKIELDD